MGPWAKVTGNCIWLRGGTGNYIWLKDRTGNCIWLRGTGNYIWLRGTGNYIWLKDSWQLYMAQGGNWLDLRGLQACILGYSVEGLTGI